MAKYVYKFHVSYQYMRGGIVHGYGSVTYSEKYNDVSVKHIEAEISESLQKDGVADQAIVLNVMPAKVKGSKVKVETNEQI